jgi:CheY-like chemotaxis protein
VKLKEEHMALKPPVVLLIDDHPDSVEMYAMALVSEGFDPISAPNAENGFARACECHPDVIVADLRLPGDSGLELARRLREDRRTTDAGIIMLTGDVMGQVRDEAFAAGCDRFLLKPCMPDTLALEIRKVLRDRRTAA